MHRMTFTDFRMGRPAFEGTAHQRSDGLDSGRLSRHPRLWKGLGAERGVVSVGESVTVMVPSVAVSVAPAGIVHACRAIATKLFGTPGS